MSRQVAGLSGADGCDRYRRLRKSTPPEKNVLWKIGLETTKSGAGGEEFMLLFCRADARAKGVFFHGHRYDEHFLRSTRTCSSTCAGARAYARATASAAMHAFTCRRAHMRTCTCARVHSRMHAYTYTDMHKQEHGPNPLQG